MNLVIDIGNTLIKYAVFDGHTILFDQTSEKEEFLATVKALFNMFPAVGRALLSSVGGLDHKEREVLALFCKLYVLSPDSKIPFKNKYASPKRLGMDRVALVAAAFYKIQKKNVLVIDAGTCVTYDFINSFGEYMGGAISPGVGMRYRAMHDKTASLPLLDPAHIDDFIGDNTENCMHSGVINGISQEVDGVIDQYRSRFSDLTVILTGGDAHFFAKRLKNTIFAHSKFLLEGLNYLLEYNKR